MTETAARCARFPLHPLVLAMLSAASGVAWSQGTPPPAVAAGGAEAPAEAPAAKPAAARDVNTLEPVYVTANRRRERAKDVAGSVNVLSGGQLEQRGMGSIDEVAGYVPGLQVTGESPGNQRLSIRGITTGSLQSGASVATYLDEQPVSLSNSIIGGAAITNDIDPLDLERIEVLKGPQGSLYGASALGGLVKYVTVAPNLKDLEGRAEVGYTSIRGDSGHSARVAVNLPVLTDLLALRMTAYSRKEPGYVEDSLRGRKDLNAFKNEGARLTALLKPSARFDAKLVLDTQTLKSDDATLPHYDATTLQPRYGADTAQQPLAQPIKNAYDRVALTLNYDLGFASLLSVTSYAHIKNNFARDASDYGKFLDFISVAAFAQAGFPVTPLNPSAAAILAGLDTKKKVQELRLTSPSGQRFDWLAGLFFQEEANDAHSALDFYSGTHLGTPSSQFLDGNVRGTLREKAAYVNATVRLGSGFDVQGGLRYTALRQSYASDLTTYNYLIGGPLAAPSNATATSEHQATWMLSPRWVLSADDMVYLRAASGYRPGGPNVPDALGTLHAPLKSDAIVNYELGYKGVFRAAKVDLNVALFRIDWKDIQVTATDAASGASYYANGGKAKSQGVELEAGWTPVQRLRLSTTLSAMEAKLTEDVAAVNGLSGDDIPFTPKISASLAADYGWAWGDGQMSAGLSLRHVGKRKVVFSHQPAAALVPTLQAPELPAYDLLDLRASYAIDRWTISLFLKNALNKRAPVYYSGQQVVPNLLTGAITPATVGLTQPRAITVQLRADF